MYLKAAAVLLPLAVLGTLPGCAYNSAQEQEANACRIIGPKAMIGGLAGAAGGAAIGAAAGGGRGAAIGAGIGLLAGAIAGHVADSQDCAAAQAALKAEIMAARTNQTITWNSRSGHTGQYLVTGDTYAAAGGAMCRRAESVAPPGSGEPGKGVIVCRQPDGNYTYANG
jgi:surface antigen